MHLVPPFNLMKAETGPKDFIPSSSTLFVNFIAILNIFISTKGTRFNSSCLFILYILEEIARASASVYLLSCNLDPSSSLFSLYSVILFSLPGSSVYHLSMASLPTSFKKGKCLLWFKYFFQILFLLNHSFQLLHASLENKII